MAVRRGQMTMNREQPLRAEAQFVQTRLIQKYQALTGSVRVLPLGIKGIPLGQIFSPVVIEDGETMRTFRRRVMDGENKNLIKKMTDIFLINGNRAKRVFLNGKPGCGKTMFCLKILEEWYKVKQGDQSEMEEVLAEFDLVFYVPMRQEKNKRENIADMIRDKFSEDNPQVTDLLTKVLVDDRVRMLVILDGLDEWPYDAFSFPSTYGCVNSLILTTSRPWLLEKLHIDYTLQDRNVEIVGIDPNSLETLLTSFVTHLYGSDAQDITSKIQTYKDRAQDPKVEPMLSIPLMISAFCHVWYEEEKDDEDEESGKNDVESKTYFFLFVMDVLVERAGNKCKALKDYLQGRHDKLSTKRTLMTRVKAYFQHESSKTNLLALMSPFFPNLKDFMDILSPFCKIAYEDLMSHESRLVFEKYQLEREYGSFVVESVLQVGIISLCKSPGCFNIQNVRISFLHKIVQELMAAMYMSCNPDVLQMFCESCDSVDKVQELSNVIMFTAGLDSSLANSLSRHVASIAGKDPQMVSWREMMRWQNVSMVKSLYKIHCECYSEVVHVTTKLGINSPPSYHISDVYVDGRDSEAVRLAGQFICNSHHTMVSVYLYGLVNPSHVVPYIPQHSTSLTALGVVGCSPETCGLLATVLPHLLHLQYIQYWGAYSDVDAGVVAALAGLTRLKSVELVDVCLRDGSQSLADMTQLDRLLFRGVTLWTGGWKEFLVGVLEVQQRVHVTLEDTNIDAESITMLQECPQFTLSNLFTGRPGEVELVEFDTGTSSP